MAMSLIFKKQYDESEKHASMNKRFVKAEYETPDYILVVRTFNNYQGFNRLIKNLPKFVGKVVKIQYTINNEIVTLINNHLVTDDNLDDMCWFINYLTNFGWEDSFDYSKLPKKRIYFF